MMKNSIPGRTRVRDMLRISTVVLRKASRLTGRDDFIGYREHEFTMPSGGISSRPSNVGENS